MILKFGCLREKKLGDADVQQSNFDENMMSYLWISSLTMAYTADSKRNRYIFGGVVPKFLHVENPSAVRCGHSRSESCQCLSCLVQKQTLRTSDFLDNLTSGILRRQLHQLCNSGGVKYARYSYGYTCGVHICTEGTENPCIIFSHAYAKMMKGLHGSPL